LTPFDKASQPSAKHQNGKWHLRKAFCLHFVIANYITTTGLMERLLELLRIGKRLSETCSCSPFQMVIQPVNNQTSFGELLCKEPPKQERVLSLKNYAETKPS
jgi:hypothetical protein